jgi:hypothetical protein
LLSFVKLFLINRVGQSFCPRLKKKQYKAFEIDILQFAGYTIGYI